MDPAFWFMGHPLVRAGEGVQSQGARSTWDLKGDLGGWGVPPPPLDPRLNAISLPHSACSLLPIHKFPKFLVILAFSGKNAQNIIKVPLSPRAFSPFFSQVWRKNGLNGLFLLNPKLKHKWELKPLKLNTKRRPWHGQGRIQGGPAGPKSWIGGAKMWFAPPLSK